MDLIEIALILLVILTVLLAGGVWIGIALMACGYAGMLFVGGNIPRYEKPTPKTAEEVVEQAIQSGV